MRIARCAPGRAALAALPAADAGEGLSAACVLRVRRRPSRQRQRPRRRRRRLRRAALTARPSGAARSRASPRSDAQRRSGGVAYPAGASAATGLRAVGGGGSAAVAAAAAAAAAAGCSRKPSGALHGGWADAQGRANFPTELFDVRAKKKKNKRKSYAATCAPLDASSRAPRHPAPCRPDTCPAGTATHRVIPLHVATTPVTLLHSIPLGPYNQPSSQAAQCRVRVVAVPCGPGDQWPGTRSRSRAPPARRAGGYPPPMADPGRELR